MTRISARLIGHELGKSAKEVNLMLEEIGFIKRSNLVTMQGRPTWDLTELGKMHGEPSHNPNYYFFVWDENVIDILALTFNIEKLEDRRRRHFPEFYD